MTKEKEIDLISCSYAEFRGRFKALGLENFDGELSRRIESLEDESVKEFLKLFNELEVDPNDETKELLLPLRPLSFGLNGQNGDGIEDRDAKLAYMVRNNLLQDKMILQRDNDQFYGFLPKGHRGLTLLEHAIIKHHFALAEVIGDRLSNIDQSKLSALQKKIIASQIELYNYYEDSISRKAKIPELDVFPRTYTYRNALSNGSPKLQKALIAAAMPFNLKTIQNFINSQYDKTKPNKYIQAVNPYDYLLSDDTAELLEIFDSTLLTATYLAYITDNQILAALPKPVFVTVDQEELDCMRMEYLSRIDPMRLYIEINQMQDYKKNEEFTDRLISTAVSADRLDILDIIFYDILMGKIKIVDHSLIERLYICCAGWIPRSPEILAKYTAYLRGEIDSIRQYDQETLKSAAPKFQLDILEYFISNYGIPIDTPTYGHRTALMDAAAKGNKDVVEYLIKNGAELHLIDNQYRSVLMHAVMNDKRDVVQYLVAEGANYHSEDNMGKKVLMYAASHGYYDFVQFLVLQGVNIDAMDDDGMTALMYAAQGGHLDVVQYLVAKGADINAKDKQDKTVLMYGAQEASKDLVEYLVTQGASISDVNQKNKTALMYGAQAGHLDVVQYLIANGADINAKDKQDKTVLMYGAQEGHLDVSQYLIAKGADINAKNRENKTVLMYGAQGGNKDVVEYLIKNGADINAMDKSRNTTLSYGMLKGKIEQVKILVNAGAQLDIHDVYGHTALDHAIRHFKIFGLCKNEIATLLKAGAHFDFNAHQDTPLALKELAIKYEKEKKDPRLKNLRDVKETKASFDSFKSDDLLAIKNRLLSNIQELELSKLEEEVNDENSDKAQLLKSLGLDVSGFDQVQINKLIKTATKIIDKGEKENIDPEHIVNKLAEQLVVKAEMIKIRDTKTEPEERGGGFAAKVSSQKSGTEKSM